VAAATGEPRPESRFPAAVIYGLSAVVLIVVVVVTAAVGLSARSSYGNGVDAALGAQIQRDFLGDQDAEAAALSKGDASAISTRLTGSALVDVTRQIHDQSKAGRAASVSFQTSSLSILRAKDPKDASLVIEVQEDGTKTVITPAGANSAPSQQTFSFHGDFWMRKDTSGRYLIADQSIQLKPSSNAPAFAITAVAVGLVAIVVALMLRRRSQAMPAAAAPGFSQTVSEAVGSPTTYVPVTEDSPPTAVLIRTFGGLQVHQDSEDWAPALKARPVTAFIWLRLLVASIREPMARLSLDQLGREASPHLDRETQRSRMRDIVSQGRELPSQLGDRIFVEPQAMSFKLEGCDVDAVTLLTIAAEFSGQGTLSPAEAARAHRAVDASAGIFLPEFESLEEIATERHPTLTGLMHEQREKLVTKRLELMLHLAASYSEGGRPNEAVDLLEPAFQERPERSDIRAGLAAAYRSAGRAADASALDLKQP
jgi:hypothetical protein